MVVGGGTCALHTAGTHLDSAVRLDVKRGETCLVTKILHFEPSLEALSLRSNDTSPTKILSCLVHGRSSDARAAALSLEGVCVCVCLCVCVCVRERERVGVCE